MLIFHENVATYGDIGLVGHLVGVEVAHEVLSASLWPIAYEADMERYAMHGPSCASTLARRTWLDYSFCSTY